MTPILAGGTIILAYLLESIPFGLVLTRMAGLGDIRRIGSGNIGATNVLRTGNKPLAAATLVLDGGKGAAAVLLAAFCIGHEAAPLAAVASVLGHLFPVWLGFKGGKGVATGLGTLLALNWPAGIGACLAWLAGAGISRISSVGALTAFLVAPIIAIFTGLWPDALAALLIAALVWLRHRPNIVRIVAGTEPRIGKGK